MTRATAYTEREVKFAADLGFELPDLRQIVGSTKRLPEQSLRTAYFDTADLRLFGRGITLRHRFGEDERSGKWTLKLPEEAEGSAVERTELSWTGAPDAPPAEALRILAGILRQATLQRIVVLASVRRRLVLRNDQGGELGEIDDDVVTVAKGTHKGLTFRQIELEFGDGHSPTEPTGYLVEAVVKKIRQAGAHIERVQKFAKSIGLDGPPPRDLPARPGRRATVADVIGHSIANGYERLLDHDYRLRVQPEDPPAQAVHQARVATRYGCATPPQSSGGSAIAWGRSATPMSWHSAWTLPGPRNCAGAWPRSAATSAQSSPKPSTGTATRTCSSGCTRGPTPRRSTWTPGHRRNQVARPAPTIRPAMSSPRWCGDRGSGCGAGCVGPPATQATRSSTGSGSLPSNSATRPRPPSR
jgi:hypothetical protein